MWAGAILLLAVPACAQEFRTAIDGTFAPHAMPSLSGGYEGFNIDLANELGKRLKRKITIDFPNNGGRSMAAVYFKQGHLIQLQVTVSPNGDVLTPDLGRFVDSLAFGAGYEESGAIQLKLIK